MPKINIITIDRFYFKSYTTPIIWQIQNQQLKLHVEFKDKPKLTSLEKVDIGMLSKK
tara:strand:+ start:534 stop:704 length:171 start_codon:yes stop_codon:yes gene_type:complete